MVATTSAEAAPGHEVGLNMWLLSGFVLQFHFTFSNMLTCHIYFTPKDVIYFLLEGVSMCLHEIGLVTWILGRRSSDLENMKRCPENSAH